MTKELIGQHRRREPKVFLGIEDDEPTRKLIGDVLDSCRFSYEGYGSLPDAREYLESGDLNRIFAILADNKFPGGNGGDVFELVRKRSSILPLVLLSNDEIIGDALAKLRSQGVDIILRKIDSIMQDSMQGLIKDIRGLRRQRDMS